MKKSTIEVYTVVKDDGTYLPFFIKHYKKAFPGCKFTIFNNGCTAQVLDLLKDPDCTVISWGPYDEKKLQITKNTCWQHSKADWVIVCDIDEIADINIQDIEELDHNVQVINFQGYHMLSRSMKSIPLEDLTHGVIDNSYNKYIMFRPKFNAVVYQMGAHVAITSGIKSKKIYKLLHYNQSYLEIIQIAKVRHFTYKNIHRVLEDKI
tara:strand:+ start:669 stop:1289 length:621 start_codon:yes stop_codon:yes gene_type:complete